MKIKRRKKIRISKADQLRSNLKRLLLGILLFIAIGAGITNAINTKNSKIEFIAQDKLGNIALTPSPTPTLTPTPTSAPTPTPVPLIGYCLNVPVLMYHHIQPNADAQAKGQTSLSVDNGQFDSQMNYLVSSGYTLISAQQLVDALVNHAGVPSKSIVITFDDGYNDIYTYAYPILQKYNIVGNIAVISGLVGGSDYLTWAQVEEMSRSSLVYMTNHTWSHHAVAYGSMDKARYEIATAKQQLQEHTGQNITTFVYPFGAMSTSATSALEQEGVSGAFSEIGGHWQCDSFLLSLHRTRIGNAPLSYYGL